MRNQLERCIQAVNQVVLGKEPQVRLALLAHDAELL